MSSNIEIGRLLAAIRDQARLTQGQIATKMAISQPHVSRLEAGTEGFDMQHYLAYLAQIDTSDARRAERLLQAAWTHLPRPPLNHPDIDHLIRAESALTRLANFLADDDVPQAVAGQAELLKLRIQDLAAYLRNLRHTVTWIGDIGVGKTTAACCQAGLLADPDHPNDLRGVLLDTGGGRVTLCEVSVLKGPAYALSVEPQADEEVYRMVADFTRALWNLKDLAADAPTPAVDYRPAEEIERALRNMCGLTRPPRRKGQPTPDPAVDLMAEFDNQEDFAAEVASRLTLWRRTRRDIAFDGADDRSGRQWLKETFSKINNGRHAEFSLPGRMTVSVPFPIFGEGDYEIELVDTRGVDGSAIRPDIVRRLKDRRTLNVLCSRFNSAPDLALQALLEHMTDTEVDPTLKSRLQVLALARSGEALAMRDDGGQAAADVDEGYDIKRGHVEDALGKVGFSGVDVEFFDSTGDDPSTPAADLQAKVKALRAGQGRALESAMTAVDDMLNNVAQAQAMAALQMVNKDLTIFANLNDAPNALAAQISVRLLRAFRTTHPRTVWATTRRNGAFWNFDVYQHLGAGGAAAAKREVEPVLLALRAILENRRADPEFESARSFLGQILENLNGWEADFVEAARHYAVAVYRKSLKADDALWNGIEALYGLGRADYRGDVAEALSEWFADHPDLADKFDRRISRAWRQTLLAPIRRAAGETVLDRATSTANEPQEAD